MSICDQSPDQSTGFVRHFLKSALYLLLAMVVVACRPFIFAGVMGFSESDELHRAEELTEKKRYEEAIEAYRNHMKYRLRMPDRPEWENPYFYELRIGDLYLELDKPEEALTAFRTAEAQGVASELVLDRWRFLATWYEQHGNLQKAYALLSEHRAKDPLLFDALLDRVSRKIVDQEENGAHVVETATPTPR